MQPSSEAKRLSFTCAISLILKPILIYAHVNVQSQMNRCSYGQELHHLSMHQWAVLFGLDECHQHHYRWAKKPMKPNSPKNQIKTKPKNWLTKLSGSIFIFVLHKSWFRFTKYKNHVLVNQPKNNIYIYIYIYIYIIGFPTCVSCDFPIFIHYFCFFLSNQAFIIFLQTKAYRL